MRVRDPFRSQKCFNPLTVCLPVVLACLTSPAAVIAGPSFFGLGDLPGGGEWSLAHGVSDDGSTIVGSSTSARGLEAFRWTSVTGLVGLGTLPGGGGPLGSGAFGVSADGSVVVGISDSANGIRQAYRWTFGDGMQALGLSAEGLLARSATAVSADGRIATGTASLSTDQQAFRWSHDQGVTLLGTMPGSDGITSATDISADGSIIVGTGGGILGREAFYWTEETGIQGLGPIPGGQDSGAEAVSANGDVIVGYGRDAEGSTRAFRRSNDLGMELLGEFSAFGTSADGHVVVGTRDLDLPDSRAVIWDELHGLRDLQYVLEVDLGLDLGDWILQSASDVSADGTVIVGYGLNPLGRTEAYVAIVPEPGSLLLWGVLGFALFRRNRNK